MRSSWQTATLASLTYSMPTLAHDLASSPITAKEKLRPTPHPALSRWERVEAVWCARTWAPATSLSPFLVQLPGDKCPENAGLRSQRPSEEDARTKSRSSNALSL